MKMIGETKKSYRESVLQFAADRYNTRPEYLWKTFPGYAVLRHSDNKKWYAAIMNVPKEKLGLSGKEDIDILDIKVEPVIIGSLLTKKGFMPAYHMNKGNWITILLDGSVDKEMIFSLLEMSFDLTSNRKTVKGI